MAKTQSERGASHSPVVHGSLPICRTCLPCSPSGSMWLNLGACWGREKCVVQRLEKGICPGSVLGCGRRTKSAVKIR